MFYRVIIANNALRFNLRGYNFSKFPGGMPLDPLVLACFACLCALPTMTIHIPATHINSDDTSGCAPFSKVWIRPWPSPADLLASIAS